MIEVYVLNKDLDVVGIIDAYNSLIWSDRYNALGDCELYLPATAESLDLLRIGYYLARPDDLMVCQIKTIELDTDVENGNYLVVSGYDTKGFLDQRVIWNTSSCDGSVEDFIRSLVDDALCDPDLQERQLQKTDTSQLLFLGTAAGFSEVMTEQVSYKNLGEKIREYCERYKWGYRVIYENGALYFELYKGEDRSGSVIFSELYENLSTTKYVDDETNLGNVALVAGEGEGSLRARSVAGEGEGVDRYELYVDAKDISKTITWTELKKIYPPVSSGGNGTIWGNASTGYFYELSELNVQIYNQEQLADLEAKYPGGIEVTIDGVLYYQLENITIADLPSAAPEPEDDVVLRDVIYQGYLVNRGYEQLGEFGAVKSFEGTIEPNTTFIYKEDYFLGDLVTVQNDFGITVQARIVEVVEVEDDNGHSVQPKFEYISEV